MVTSTSRMIILANSVKIVGQLEAARLDDVSCRQGERGVGAGRADLPGEADDPEEHHKVRHHAGGVKECAEVVLVGAIVIDANGEIRESLGNKNNCCVNRRSPTYFKRRIASPFPAKRARRNRRCIGP